MCCRVEDAYVLCRVDVDIDVDRMLSGAYRVIQYILIKFQYEVEDDTIGMRYPVFGMSFNLI